MDNRIYSIINGYLEKVRLSTSILRQYFECHDLLMAYKSHEIPANGIIDGKYKFFFHGVGCRIEYTEWTVDFDFQFEGRTEGFDSWRLWEYVQSCKEKYPGIESLEMIEKDISTLANSGLIKKTEQPPSPHLYVFSKDYTI